MGRRPIYQAGIAGVSRGHRVPRRSALGRERYPNIWGRSVRPQIWLE